MYLETHLIPNNRDEWIINLHISSDDTKIEARIIKGYKQALEETKKWSEELGGCKYTIGSLNKDGSK